MGKTENNRQKPCTAQINKKIRPMRKRVKRLMRLSTFLSLALVIVVFMFLMLTALKVTSKIYMDNQAYQMSIIVSDQWGKNPDGISAEEHLKETLDAFQITHMAEDGSEVTLDEDKMAIYLSESNMDNPIFLIPDLIQYNVCLYEHHETDPVYSNYDVNHLMIKDTSKLSSLLSALSSESRASIFETPDLTTMMSAANDMMIQENNDTSDKMDDETYEAFLDKYEIGYVTARLNPDYMAAIIFALIVFSFIIFIIINIVISLIVKLISKMIAHPVESISRQMASLADDDIEDSMATGLNVKNPVLELKSLMDSTNKIMGKMDEYSHKLADQNDELEAQNEEMEAQRDELEAQRDELEAQNITLEDRSKSLSSLNNAYLSRTLKLQNLLDNVGQGFLTFGSDLLIDDEYTLECEEIMSCEIDGTLADHSIIDALYAKSTDGDFIESLFHKIFESDLEQRDLYMSLLPEELETCDKVLNLEYKMVKDEHGKHQMMMVITDITETRSLEKRMDLERNNLKMIVKVLLNRSEFLEVIEDYKIFANSNFDILAETAYENTLRNIHTHKGSFSQYYLENITKYLNELESKLYDDQNQEIMAALTYDEMVSALNADLEVVESYIGKDFLYNDSLYTIHEEKVFEIENKIKDLLPSSEYNKIVPIIQSIRHKTVKEQLKTYPDYTVKLGERLEKSINTFEIEGDDIYVDPMVYQKTFKSLVHIFRNAVDHGIEEADNRLESGKALSANIRCLIEDFVDHFTITISDDGKGLIPEELIESAKTKGIVSSSETLTEEEAYQLIFADGISTKENVTTLSGRGVGLAAVRYAVEELGGNIQVTSSIGQGTSFTISLPYISNTEVISFTPEKLLGHITKVTERHLENMNIHFSPDKVKSGNMVTLKRVSALINIKGAVEAILIISTNTSLGKKLVEAFMFEVPSEDDLITYIEDVLGEVTNTILGNMLGILEEEGVCLTIGVPALISNKDAYIKYTESQIVSIDYQHGSDEMSMNLLLLDDGNQ